MRTASLPAELLFQIQEPQCGEGVNDGGSKSPQCLLAILSNRLQLIKAPSVLLIRPPGMYRSILHCLAFSVQTCNALKLLQRTLLQLPLGLLHSHLLHEGVAH